MAHNAQRVMLGLAISTQAIFGGLPASAQLSIPPRKVAWPRLSRLFTQSQPCLRPRQDHPTPKEAWTRTQ